MEAKKFLIVLTHAADDPERANLGLAFAAAMIGDELDVAILFMFDGVYLARKGEVDSIAAPNVTPAKDLMNIITEGGAKLMACTPCVMKRSIEESELLDGCKLISAATVIPEMASREVVTF